MKRLILSIVLIFALGCSHARFYSRPGDDYYLLADYQTALMHWTEKDEIHHNLIGVAELTAVYKSWEVRQSYLYTFKNKANPKPEILERTTLRELNGFHNGHEFIVGLYCSDKKWETLTGMDPLWRLTLETDKGFILDPILIEKIEIEPAEKWCYWNYQAQWHKLFKVVFPLTTKDLCSVIDSETSFFILHCDSILGNMQLKWVLKPVPVDLM